MTPADIITTRACGFRSVRYWLVVGAAFLLMVSGCTSKASSQILPSAMSSFPMVVSTSSTMAGTVRQVIAAYVGMWRDMLEIASSEKLPPHLGDHAAGDVLASLARGVYIDHRRGVVTIGAPVGRPIIERLNPPDHPYVATVSACFDDMDWLRHNARDGHDANATGGRHLVHVALSLMGSKWKVVELFMDKPGTC